MILTQIKFRGKDINPFFLKENHCYFGKDGKEIKFACRPAELPDYYVAGAALYSDNSTTHYDEETNSMLFNSLYHFKVVEDSLIIN